jgi:hypothetical protein
MLWWWKSLRSRHQFTSIGRGEAMGSVHISRAAGWCWQLERSAEISPLLDGPESRCRALLAAPESRCRVMLRGDVGCFRAAAELCRELQRCCRVMLGVAKIMEMVGAAKIIQMLGTAKIIQILGTAKIIQILGTAKIIQILGAAKII